MSTQRIIKRYTNRKLYDTDQSRYVTLEDIAKLVRAGEDVRVIDNEAGEDLTAITFAQIILEEEKRKTNLVSVPFLRKLIRSGESAVQDIGDAATRSIERLGELTEKAGERVLDAARGGSRAIDGLVNLPQRQLEELRDATRGALDRLRESSTVQREVDRIEKSLKAIEELLANLKVEERESATASEGDASTPEATAATPDPAQAQPEAGSQGVEEGGDANADPDSDDSSAERSA
ncbi:MAG: polyhydroxyalkanoate synthesis repressor PhaR [Hyphomicrobiaceae bacterium]|jgi:polyhydroxyalkanoate synthesis repressor PhaR